MIRRFRHSFVLALLAIALVVVPVTINVAGTSAANYHWAREQSRFTTQGGRQRQRQLEQALAQYA